MSALLEATELVKVYRTGATEVRAVDKVSFRVETGSSIGLVGESGSGKTTTARLLVAAARRELDARMTGSGA